MYERNRVMYPLFLSDFNETWTLTDFGKNTQTSHSIKIGSEGADLFRADRQTDAYNEANNRLSQFCNRV